MNVKGVDIVCLPRKDGRTVLWEKNNSMSPLQSLLDDVYCSVLIYRSRPKTRYDAIEKAVVMEALVQLRRRAGT